MTRDEEYAEDLVVGGERTAGLHVDGWAFAGEGLDHEDRANARGWCWRDTQAALERMYAGPAFAKLTALFNRPSPFLSAVRRARDDSSEGPRNASESPAPALAPAATKSGD